MGDDQKLGLVGHAAHILGIAGDVGFVQGGLLPYDGNDPGPSGAEARAKFRSRMHRLQDLLFQDGFMRNTVGAGPVEDRQR